MASNQEKYLKDKLSWRIHENEWSSQRKERQKWFSNNKIILTKS